LTEEKASISFQDNAIVGDVTITQNNAECPSCSASNAIVLMKCQETHCENKFCNLCHPKCRYSEGSFLRFDSGEGLGPFCKGCGTVIFTAWKEREERERVEREREEREESERRVRESYIKRERGESERRVREEIVKREREERVKREREESERRVREERVKREREESERRVREERVKREREESEKREREESEKREREESERREIKRNEYLPNQVLKWKDHYSSLNKVYKKRLIYSLMAGFLLMPVALFSPREATPAIAFIGGSLCFIYPLYLMTMIIICLWGSKVRYHTKLLNQSVRKR